jgi:predicted lipoprotein with Yx(FWY)xxD motif
MVKIGISPVRVSGLVAAGALALVGAAACSSSASKPATPSSQGAATTAPPSPAAGSGGTSAPSATQSTVMSGSATVNGSATTVLVAQDGKTLYYFTPDTAGGMPTCTATCAQAWPPLTVAAPTAGSGVTGSLKVVMGANGDQVTYNGHPLYEYTGDTTTGQANGQGVLGKWFVATPSLAAGAGTPSGTPTTGGSSSGGYRY